MVGGHGDGQGHFLQVSKGQEGEKGAEEGFSATTWAVSVSFPGGPGFSTTVKRLRTAVGAAAKKGARGSARRSGKESGRVDKESIIKKREAFVKI